MITEPSEDRRIAELTAERDEARAAVRRVQDAIRAGAVSVGPIALALCSVGDGVGPSLLDELHEARERMATAEAERDGLTETIRHLSAELDELLAHPFDVGSLPDGVDPVAYLGKRLTAAWNQLDRVGDWALRLSGDLADMTARAESAEHRYDQARGERDLALCVVEAAEAWVDMPPVKRTLVGAHELEAAVMAYRVKESPLTADELLATRKGQRQP